MSIKLESVKVEVKVEQFTSKVTDNAAVRPSANQNNGVENGLHKTGMLAFESSVTAARLNQTFQANQTNKTGAPNTPQTTAVVDRVLDEYDRRTGNAAGVLANELRNLGPQERAAVMGELANRNPEAMLEILEGAGGDWNEQFPVLASTDRAVIANSLGSAFTEGNIGQDFLNKMMTEAGTDGVGYIGNLLGNGGAPATSLREAFANAALAKAFSPEAQQNFLGEEYAGAAIRALGNDVAALNRVLTPYNSANGVNGKKLSDVINLVAEAPNLFLTSSEYTGDALSIMMNTAARLPQSSQDLAFNIFRNVVDNQGGSSLPQNRAEALANIFNRHSDYITSELTDIRDAGQNENYVTLSRFFQSTLFNRDVSDTVKSSLRDTLRDIAADYRASGKPYQLGALAGSIENGFELAVKDQNDRREAVKDFIGTLLDFLPQGKKLSQILGSVLDNIPAEQVDELAGLARGEAENRLTDLLLDKLTSQEGFALWTNDKVKNRNQVDEVFRNLFDTASLSDADIERYNNGIVYAHASLDGSDYSTE